MVQFNLSQIDLSRIELTLESRVAIDSLVPVFSKLIESSTAATSTLDTTETEEPTSTSTTTTTTTTSLNRNRESFTDIVTRGNVAWVMEKQKNAYELGYSRQQNFDENF